MRRRAFLSAVLAPSVAGCSQLAGPGAKSLGDTASIGDFRISVSDAMASRTITLTTFERETLTAPSNAIFGLFEIAVENTDITVREGPAVSYTNYDDMATEENELQPGLPNDIRVYGSGEGGHIPEEIEDTYGYERISVNGADLETYPVSVTGHGPDVPPDSSVGGWVFGVIPVGTTPELKVQFDPGSATWSAEGESLATPTPPSGIVLD